MTHEELTAQIQRVNNESRVGNYEVAEHLAKKVIAEIDSTPSLDTSGGSVDSLRAEAFLSLATTSFRSGNYDAALEQALQVLAQAEGYSLSDIQASVHNLLGNVYLQLGNYTIALEYYLKAISAYESTGVINGVAIVTGNIGIVYFNLGNYSLALEYYMKTVSAYEEIGHKLGLASVMGNIGNVYLNLGNYTIALEYYLKALSAHKELGEIVRVADDMMNIGNVYYNLGNYSLALEYYVKAVSPYEEIGQKSGIARSTGNIGLVYNVLGNYSLALEYLMKAVSVHEEIGEISFVARVMGSIGNVYNSIGNYTIALEYYMKAVSAYEELGEIAGVATITVNIGVVYYNLGNYSLALEYYMKALAAHEELGEISGVALITGNIGSLYATRIFEGYDAHIAEEYLLKAIALSTEIGAKALLVEPYKSLAELYEYEKRWEEAHEQFKKFYKIEKEVQSEESKKQAAILEQQKQAEAREKEVAIANAKHAATEELLHNVLPPSIANKMVSGEKLIAEKLPSVSVLFADIVNFTKLSQRITPEELVEGLDRIFSAFDALAEKHGLEKIKTIGDAYMVVSGAPIQREDHAETMAHFALEMVDAMKEFRSISTGEEIQLRIGIHSGEVVAGVIGKKKFAYDLWGDAVNTASRMESHGEAGKIHVSEEFMHALSPRSPMSLHFQERGEMAIKGKGMMKTYFLEGVRT